MGCCGGVSFQGAKFQKPSLPVNFASQVFKPSASPSSPASPFAQQILQPAFSGQGVGKRLSIFG